MLRFCCININTMLGIVDTGGGLRGAYGAGILDYCLDRGIGADYFIGVSAGSANGASFLGGQKGRNLRYYNEYAFRREYMSVRNLLRKGSYLDLDYVYGVTSNSDGEDPLNYKAIIASPCRYEAVTTDAVSGAAVYFSKEDMQQDDYTVLKCSSCLPAADKPVYFRGRYYYDGGLSDPIPWQRALDQGCDRLIIVLTRPKTEMRTSLRDRQFSRLIPLKYAASAEALRGRAALYNRELCGALELEEQGRALILSPADVSGMKTLTKDHAAILRMYKEGYRAAEAVPAFIQK